MARYLAASYRSAAWLFQALSERLKTHHARTRPGRDEPSINPWFVRCDLDQAVNLQFLIASRRLAPSH